jgi:hypothetical protein
MKFSTTKFLDNMLEYENRVLRGRKALVAKIKGRRDEIINN